MDKKVQHKRHVAKALSWRFIATIDTIVLGWIITGKFGLGFSIGLLEIVTKVILYYFHERLWYKLKVLHVFSSRLRHLLKTFTWRFFGTLDTVLLAWFVTGKLEYGISIGGFELITKMILYYVHERIWYQSAYGIITFEPIVENAVQDRKG